MKLTTNQLRRLIREEAAAALVPTADRNPQRFLHGFDSGRPADDEGYMVKSRMLGVKTAAETICGLLDDGDQLPAWVQDLVASAHADLEHVKSYLVGDEKLRAGKAMGAHGKTMESRSSRGSMLLEGHARITPDEMKAWMGGDWGYVAEAAGHSPVDDYEEVDQQFPGAIDSAANALGVRPDEVEFGLTDSGELHAGGGLTGEMTHSWNGKMKMWEVLP